MSLAVVNRFFRVAAWTSAALFTYWHVYESDQPGQQYADPLIPCLLLSLYVATVWTLGVAFGQGLAAAMR